MIWTPHPILCGLLNREEWDELGMWYVWVRRGGVYRVLVGKPEEKRPLERPRRRWVDKITMDLQKVRCGYMDWIGLAQDIDRWRMLVSALMKLRVPWNAGNFLTSCKPVSFSKKTLHHGVSKYYQNFLVFTTRRTVQHTDTIRTQYMQLHHHRINHTPMYFDGIFLTTVTLISTNWCVPWWWCNCNTETCRSCLNVNFNIVFF